MRDTKGERREEKRRKKRHGMKVSGRSVLTLAEQVVKKAEEAKSADSR